MGAQVECSKYSLDLFFQSIVRIIMAMKKAMKARKSMKSGAKAMAKGVLVKAIAEQHGLKNAQCSGVLDSLAAIGAQEVKKTGVFAIPGLCRIKTRRKPATKACTREIFGEMRKIKAKPAKTVVKAFAVSALKNQVC